MDQSKIIDTFDTYQSPSGDYAQISTQPLALHQLAGWVRSVLELRVGRTLKVGCAAYCSCELAPYKSNLHAQTFVSSFAGGDNVGDRLQLLPRPSYRLEDFSSWLNPIFQGPLTCTLCRISPPVLSSLRSFRVSCGRISLAILWSC